MAKTNRYKKDDEWDSGLQLIKKPDIFIPRFLDDLMNEIDDKKDVDANAEFSIFVVSKINGFDISLTNEYFIPKQRVHSAEVEYDEARPNQKFNTVIHRHPNSMPNHFSGDSGDDGYINRNFDVSILWTEKDGFSYGQYNMYSNRKRLAIPCEIFVIRPEIKIKGLHKIKKYSYVEDKSKGYKVEKDNKGVTVITGNGFSDDDIDYSGNGAISNFNKQPDLFNQYRANLKEKTDYVTDKLNGSSILDNNNKLVDYNKAMHEEGEAIDEDWLTKALDFFDGLQDGMAIVDLTHELFSVLDTFKPNYSQDNLDTAGHYWQLMEIVANVAIYWSWKPEMIKNLGQNLANLYVTEQYAQVEGRVKSMYEYAMGNYTSGQSKSNIEVS